MKILGVIPARLSSSRLPNKVLQQLGDKTIIQWVYEAVIASKLFDKVVIATDSQAIIEEARSFNAETVMTSNVHTCGTERVGELLPLFPDYEVIVNVQADQPFLTTRMLRDLMQPYIKGELCPMVTLAAPFHDKEEWQDPNVVKVVLDCMSNALYFSRSPIPFRRESTDSIPVYKHLGLYAFSREFLKTYLELDNTPLGKSESLEQLRVIEYGYKIKVNLTERAEIEINSPQDLIQAKLSLN